MPAIIREASDKDVLELALIENLQRENLSPLEEAAGYMRLKTEFRMKQGDIAKRVGKSRAAVANSMRLLDLPQPVQDMLGNTFISVGHAKVLLSLKNKDQQIQLGRDIVNKGATPSARRKRPFRRCSTCRIRLPLKSRPPLSTRKFPASSPNNSNSGEHLRPGKPGLHRNHLLQQSGNSSASLSFWARMNGPIPSKLPPPFP